MPFLFLVLLFSPIFSEEVLLSSFRSFWVLLFSPFFSWCCQICSSPLWVVVVFLPCERQPDGAKDVNQVAVKQSEANKSYVVLFRVAVVFPPPPFGWRCFPASLPSGCARSGVAVNLLLFI